METCGGCGFRNGAGRDTCARCGRVFHERRGSEGLKLAIAALVGLAALAAGVVTVIRVFDPFAKPPPVASREEPRPPAAEPVAGVVSRPPLPESPARKQGEAFLRQAERAFAEGDYPAAAAAYEEARFFGALEGEAVDRKESSDCVVRVRDIRDYLAKESYFEPPRITLGHLHLSKMDPAKLPTAAWREEHRKTLARLEKLVATVDLPGAKQAEK